MSAKQSVLLGTILKDSVSKEARVQHKQQLLKNMLLRVNQVKERQAESSEINGKLKSSFFNKGNSLQSLNDISMFKHQIFKFNKSLEINTVLLDRRVSDLLKKYVCVSLEMDKKNKSGKGEGSSKDTANIVDMKTVNPIYMSSPVFKHSPSKVEISFYYYNNFDTSNRFYNKKAKYFVPVITQLMTSLSDSGSHHSLAFALEQYYGKPVVIKPKKLKYVFNNNEILTQYISKQIRVQPNFASRLARTLNDIVPQINDEKRAVNYNLKLVEKTESKLKAAKNQVRNGFGKLDVTSLYKSDTVHETGKDLLMYKYLVGAQITHKGRSMRKAAIARSQKEYFFKGTLRNKIYNYNVLSNRYKMNFLKSNISVNQCAQVTRYGKLNVAIKSNYV